MGKMKGTGWLGNLEYIEQVAGPEGMSKIKAALSEDDRRLIFDKTILPISWLDYGAYVRFMVTADKVVGKGDLELIRQAARYNAGKDLKGIYRLLISFVSVKAILNTASKVWKQYFDEGTMNTESVSATKGVLTVTGFSQMPANHEVPHSEFIAESIRLSGGKSVQWTHPKCLARGDDHCRFEFTWK